MGRLEEEGEEATAGDDDGLGESLGREAVLGAPGSASEYTLHHLINDALIATPISKAVLRRSSHAAARTPRAGGAAARTRPSGTAAPRTRWGPRTPRGGSVHVIS